MRDDSAFPSKAHRDDAFEKFSSEARLDERSMITTVRVQAVVRVTFEDVAASLLPENWVADPAFSTVYRICRNDMSRSFRGNEPFTFDRDSASLPHDRWSAIYYEHVEAGVAGWSTEFHNLLNAQFLRTEQEAALTYSLDRCLRTRWGWLTRESAGIDVDRGYTRIRDQGDGTTCLDIAKSLRYTAFKAEELIQLGAIALNAQIMNWLAPIFLKSWIEQLVITGFGAESTHSPLFRT